jgi:hypothetical protein
VQVRPRSVIFGALAACALVAAAVGVAIAGVPEGAPSKTQAGPNVYTGMSDDEIIAVDRRSAADHATQVREYIAAHRADLESSLSLLPVAESAALLRPLGANLPEVVDNSVAAIYGRVVSVRVDATGALVSTVEIFDVGKRGTTNLTTGGTVDLAQTARVDLDEHGRPELVVPSPAPALLVGETGVYFLSRSGTAGALAIVGLGSTFPVVDGVIAAPDATVPSWVDGRSPASLLTEIRKDAQE